MAADHKKLNAGWTLFQAGFQQQDISRILNVSENTISKWARDNDWKSKKAKAAMLDDNIVSKLHAIASYQVDCLYKQMEDQQDAGEFKPLANGVFDGLQKVLSTIKQDFNDFKLNVHVLKRFTDFLQQQDLELAKQVLPHADLFLNDISRDK